jgi:hypothetical protein
MSFESIALTAFVLACLLGAVFIPTWIERARYERNNQKSR